MPRPVSYFFFVFFYGPRPFLINAFLIKHIVCSAGKLTDKVLINCVCCLLRLLSLFFLCSKLSTK